MSSTPESDVELPIFGQEITQIRFDHAVSLLFEGGGLLRIGGSFMLDGGATEPEARLNLAPVLNLFRDSASSAAAGQDGVLVLHLASGRHLIVASDQTYEPWEFIDPTGFRIVSSPGGRLTVWGDH